jgi:Fe-S-cluster containining protein
MTDCSRCGDCCDPVIVTFDPQERAAERLANLSFVAPAWAWHQFEFLRDHWRTVDTYESTERGRPVTVHRVECDQFDRATRTCGAHDDRPQVCSGFPWYGREPDVDSAIAGSLSPRCSYNADVRTMLPIVEVR